MKEYQFHELASIFPMLQQNELVLLSEDIKTNGLLNPISLYEGKILDGRNRYEACKLAKVEPTYVETVTNDPLRYVISLNLSRRHLNESQRAVIAERLANMKLGGDKEAEKQSANLHFAPPLISRQNAAKMLNIGVRNISSIREIKEKQPEKIAEIERGDTTVHAVLKDIKHKERREKIEQNFVVNEMPKGLYNVIYCDPPWEYEHCESKSRDVGNNYKTMPLEDIKKLSIPSSANSILLMWTTAPKFEEAISVINAWGFKYRTCAIWDKQIIGMGYWFRIQHELLLVAIKGNFPTPEPDVRESSVYSEKRTEHSKKPDHYYELIERYFPNGKYLELFARKRYNEKWEVWGSENK